MSVSLERALEQNFSEISPDYLAWLSSPCTGSHYWLSQAHQYEFAIAVEYCTAHKGARILVAGRIDGHPLQVARSMLLLDARRSAMERLVQQPMERSYESDIMTETMTYDTGIRIATQHDLDRLVKGLREIAEDVDASNASVN